MNIQKPILPGKKEHVICYLSILLGHTLTPQQPAYGSCMVCLVFSTHEGLEDFAERFSAVDGSQVDILDHDTVMAVIVMYLFVFVWCKRKWSFCFAWMGCLSLMYMSCIKT